jgi:tetratricopeptide (TPR) repeat protein
MLDLPSVPSGVMPDDAGLSDLERMKGLDRFVRSGLLPESGLSVPSGADLVRQGVAGVQRGDSEAGLAQIQAGIRLNAGSLVLGNAYRMVTFQLRRQWLMAAKRAGQLAVEFPSYLKDEPIAFLTELAKAHPCRETKLQLALAWVDQMLLFPALEIKAPASVEAVKILDDILAKDSPSYVPALYARGLNHLHRPARLVWPEADKVPLDAAVRDIGLCLAIGRRVGVGSDRLKATMAMALGDAYVKAGRNNVARSWWQIAQNLCGDSEIQEGVRRRYGWRDDDLLDRLEEELDRAREQLDHPMTDLAFMWNGAPPALLERAAASVGAD